MSFFTPELLAQAQAVLEQCRAQKLTLATAESCTGGLLSALITEIPGSSDVFTFGFVPYANAAKIALLGVSPERLARDGAVSEQTAIAMAEGACNASHATLSIAITGIAGPGGGTAEKPVGLVHFASSHHLHGTLTEHAIFPGDRAAIRAQSVVAALKLLQRQLTR